MEKAGSNAVYTWCTRHDVSPKLCSDISGFLHEVPTRCIQNNIKYWPFCLIRLRTIQKSWFAFYTWQWFTQHNVRNIACNIRDVKVQAPLQNCECQFKWNEPCWVTQQLNCMYLEQFIQNPLLLHRNFSFINTNALNVVVVFYVTSATVLFHSISLIEISQLAKLYSQVNMSVGTNMFINGKLDNSPLYSVCARLKFENWVWM